MGDIFFNQEYPYVKKKRKVKVYHDFSNVNYYLQKENKKNAILSKTVYSKRRLILLLKANYCRAKQKKKNTPFVQSISIIDNLIDRSIRMYISFIVQQPSLSPDKKCISCI